MFSGLSFGSAYAFVYANVFALCFDFSGGNLYLNQVVIFIFIRWSSLGQAGFQST